MLEEQGENPMVFRDRREAGRRLVRKLERYRGNPKTVVLGLPRGGVVTADEIAAGLHLPLDVIISRKIGAPGNEEYAIGAIAEGGEPYLTAHGIELTGASESYLQNEVARQRREIERRRMLFRAGKPLDLPKGTTVILVDDGVATGSTVIAAIHALRRAQVARLVLAIPVAPPDTVEVLRGLVDELVVLSAPVMFWAVGAFFDDFRQVSDEEVCDLLREAARRQTSPPERAAAL
jgi:predicted phosphoribosyltransferase